MKQTTMKNISENIDFFINKEVDFRCVGSYTIKTGIIRASQHVNIAEFVYPFTLSSIEYTIEEKETGNIFIVDKKHLLKLNQKQTIADVESDKNNQG